MKISGWHASSLRPFGPLLLMALAGASSCVDVAVRFRCVDLPLESVAAVVAFEDDGEHAGKALLLESTDQGREVLRAVTLPPADGTATALDVRLPDIVDMSLFLPDEAGLPAGLLVATTKIEGQSSPRLVALRIQPDAEISASDMIAEKFYPGYRNWLSPRQQACLVRGADPALLLAAFMTTGPRRGDYETTVAVLDLAGSVRSRLTLPGHYSLVDAERSPARPTSFPSDDPLGWHALAIGSHQDSRSSPPVYSVNWLRSRDGMFQVERAIVPRLGTAERPTTARILGDVDGDGASEVAVGFPYLAGGSGAVRLYDGGSGEVLATLTHPAALGLGASLEVIGEGAQAVLVVGAPGDIYRWPRAAEPLQGKWRPYQGGNQPSRTLGWTITSEPTLVFDLVSDHGECGFGADLLVQEDLRQWRIVSACARSRYSDDVRPRLHVVDVPRP